MQQFCTDCGNAIAVGEKFCRQCGIGVALETIPSGVSAVTRPVMPVVESPIGVSAGNTPLVDHQGGVHVQVVNTFTPQTVQSHDEATPKRIGTYGLPIPSLVIGIIFTLSLFDNSRWDSDTIDGAAAFCIAGLVLGIVSVCRQRKGKGMAVAGIVLSSIGLLGAIGRLP